jgi:hypothetical protein
MAHEGCLKKAKKALEDASSKTQSPHSLRGFSGEKTEYWYTIGAADFLMVGRPHQI